MPFITQGKTNWKFIGIVAVLAVIVGGGIWFLSVLESEEPAIHREEIDGETELLERLDKEGAEKDLIEMAYLLCEQHEWTEEEIEKFGWFPPGPKLTPGPAFPVAFTGSEKREVLGTCGEGAFGGHMMWFVLDEKGDVILREGPVIKGQRQFTFDDMIALDIDGNGIDEIIYKEAGWTMSFIESTVHLYAPNYEEWMYIKEIIRYSDKKDVWTREFSHSENLEHPEYQIFREALQKTMQEWDFAASARSNLPPGEFIEEEIEEIIKYETTDWQIYRNEEIGIEFRYPEEIFGNPFLAWGEEASKSMGIIFSFSEKKHAAPEEYSGVYFVAYMPDYKIIPPGFGIFTGDDNITTYCPESLKVKITPTGDWKMCKVIKIVGQKAIFETFATNYECCFDFWVSVYFNNQSESPYKGLVFKITSGLESYNELVSFMPNCTEEGDKEKFKQAFYGQSINILENKNLSENDKVKLDAFHQILSTFKFIEEEKN